MKKTVPLVILFWTFAFGSILAQQNQPKRLYELPGYTDVLENPKLLVVYDSETNAETMQAIFKSCEQLAVSQIGRPLIDGRWIVSIKPGASKQAAIAELEQFLQVKAVTPWLKDAGGNERGILPELYVKLKPDQDAKFLFDLAKSLGIEYKGKQQYLSDVFEFECGKNSAFNSREMAIYLNTDERVEYADANYAFFPKVHTVDDSLYFRQWSLENVGGMNQWNGTAGADMDLPNAWTLTTGNPAVKIAILDSGVDTLHPDLKPNLLPGYDATGGNSHGYPNTNFPSDGHGTACAGIAAAKGNNHIGVAGVAYDCKIVPVKIFIYIDTTISLPPIIDTTLYEIAYSETAFMVNGIGWAWQTAGVDVLSNSWGIPPELAPLAPVDQFVVMNVITDAKEQGRGGKGAIQLFSSGNENSGLIWPSNFFTNISVGATTNKDKRASFSNYGAGLDVSAPGVQVTTTDMLGTAGFSAQDYMLDFAGTSAACPNAAGVAALVLSLYPDLSFAELRSVLRISADDVGGYAYDSTNTDGTWSSPLGYGRVNAYRALLTAPVLSFDEMTGKNMNVLLYPNPSAEFVYIQMNGFETAPINLFIYDLSGKQVHSSNLMPSGSVEFSHRLDLAAYPSGIYFVKLVQGGNHFSMKFVKQ